MAEEVSGHCGLDTECIKEGLSALSDYFEAALNEDESKAALRRMWKQQMGILDMLLQHDTRRPAQQKPPADCGECRCEDCRTVKYLEENVKELQALEQESAMLLAKMQPPADCGECRCEDCRTLKYLYEELAKAKMQPPADALVIDHIDFAINTLDDLFDEIVPQSAAGQVITKKIAALRREGR